MSSVVLNGVREKMSAIGVDAFIVGSGDAHQSEYVHASDMRRAYVSKFDGSSGTALILKQNAYLWTDGRYFLQASKQLPSYWTLMKSGEPGILEINDWIAQNCPRGTVVGIDPSLVSAAQAFAMLKLFESKGMSLLVVPSNPVDEVWEGRPAEPQCPVAVHPIHLAGESHAEKISRLQKTLEARKCAAAVVSALDEVAWLLNIRGSDVDFNPVVVAYAVVELTETHLFINTNKLSAEVVAHLAGAKVHPYSDVDAYLTELSISAISRGLGVMVDPSQLNWRLHRCLGSAAVEAPSPLTLPKALKNRAEIDGVRACHVRDGAALTAFLHYLEEAVRSGQQLTEYDVTVKIEQFRARAALHVSPSFSTIAGYGPNGAVIHYKPEASTASTLGTDSLFLLDSGAQYRDGTTDVTRTVHFGAASDHMKRCYTLVLKGHIALARAVFPEGTLGSRLDCIARLPLWSAGLDYNHGTGHGVGAFLNVHEGPQGIGFRARVNEAGFAPGMTVSNEPGYYEEGAFGIRIENVCVTVEADTPFRFGGRRFCRLETVTMTPIKTDLIAVALMDEAELRWLDDYHRQVRTALQSVVQDLFPEAVDYLIRETAPLLAATPAAQ